MKFVKAFSVLGVALALSACDIQDKTRDTQTDSGDLSNLIAGIWIDPNGCQHWIIDDGVEGYLSARLDKYGKPVCTDVYPEGYAIGNFRQGEGISDIL